jgi:hypothetical protein
LEEKTSQKQNLCRELRESARIFLGNWVIFRSGDPVITKAPPADYAGWGKKDKSKTKPLPRITRIGANFSWGMKL